MRQKWKFILSASIRWKKVKSTEWILQALVLVHSCHFHYRHRPLCCRDFRLDALDYLMDGLNFSTFSSLSAKRHAGSLCGMQVRPTQSTRQGPEEVPKVIYMWCDNRIMRLDLERINYYRRFGRLCEDFLQRFP